MELLNFENIIKDEELLTYINYADETFAVMGYKEHGVAHAMFTAERAGFILEQLGYTKRIQELAKIAGFFHDVGNVVARRDHPQSSSIIAMHILQKMRLEDEKYNSDFFEIFGAIGSHEDKHMFSPTAIAAAVVLGDKTDVRCQRLRNQKQRVIDTHTKVIAACKSTDLVISKENKEIALKLEIDTNISSIMNYFEIFTQRTIYCSKACSVLGCKFSLYINGDKFL